MEIKDYTQYSINDEVISSGSVLKSYQVTDALAVDQMYEGIPGGNVIFGGMQLRKKSYLDTASGIWLGVDKDGRAKINVGDSSDYMKWNGTSLLISGTLVASAIDIPNATSVSSFHVDVDGNMWVGATTFASAPARIGASGAARFTNVTIGGYVEDGGAADDVNNYSTKISGGKIVTGSVTALQIDVTDLFSQTITATGSITGALLRTSSGGTRVELNSANNSLRFYSGGSLKEEITPTTLGNGGIRLNQGEIFVANNRAFNSASTSGTQWGSFRVNESNQLIIVTGSDNTFYLRNNDESHNGFTYNFTSGRFYINGSIQFEKFSSNPTYDGQMLYYDDGVNTGIRVRMRTGSGTPFNIQLDGHFV